MYTVVISTRQAMRPGFPAVRVGTPSTFCDRDFLVCYSCNRALVSSYQTSLLHATGIGYCAGELYRNSQSVCIRFCHTAKSRHDSDTETDENRNRSYLQ